MRRSIPTTVETRTLQATTPCLPVHLEMLAGKIKGAHFLLSPHAEPFCLIPSHSILVPREK